MSITQIGRRLSAYAAALAVAGTALVVAAEPANAGCALVVIWSTDSYQYITAEKDYSPAKFKGELRARADTVGAWEKFTMCFVNGWTFSLKAQANGKYVAVEEDYAEPYKNMLRARSDSVGAWETFTLINPGGDVHGIVGSPNLFVSAEFGYGDPHKGMLRARTKQAGPWECFNYQSL